MNNRPDFSELFEPLRLWKSMWVQRFYVPMGIVAVAAYGWAILETRMLPRWGRMGLDWAGRRLAVRVPTRRKSNPGHDFRGATRDRHCARHSTQSDRPSRRNAAKPLSEPATALT